MKIIRNQYLQVILCTILAMAVLKNAYSQSRESQIYFLSTSGNDQFLGTKEKPFKSFKRIQQAISENSGSKEISIYIRSGVYCINESLVLGDSTSSTRNIKISAFEKEKVSIIGGVILDNNKFSKVIEQKTLNLIPKERRTNIYFTNLNDQGINNLGSLHLNGFGKAKQPSAMEISIDGKPMTIARWPNTGLLPINKVVKNSNVENEGETIFEYSSTHPKQWNSLKNLWVGGYLNVGWAYDNLPIEKLDTDSSQIYFKGSASYGTFSSNDSSSDLTKSARSIRGFYFYNSLEELDSANEYYVDQNMKLLYVYLPAGIKNQVISASVLEKPLIVIRNANNITIENIDFADTRGNIVYINNSENIKALNCSFKNSGLLGIESSHSKNIQVINSTFSGLGAGGISLSGGNTTNLNPSNDIIKGCEFSNYSRLYQSYTPAINLNTVGDTIINCFIHDAPDQAIIYTGNQNYIYNNHIKNVCLSFNDIGAIYTGRDLSSLGNTVNSNYFENINNDTKRKMVAALYIDDGNIGTTASDNIFQNINSKNDSLSFGAIHLNGGVYNLFDRNTFINCAKAISTSYWKNSLWVKTFLQDSMYVRKKVYISKITSPLYLTKYPFLKEILDTTKTEFRNNLVSNSTLINVHNIFSGRGLKFSNTDSFKDASSTPKEKIDLIEQRKKRY